MTSKPYRHSWEDMSEDVPIDVLPCSNDEYFPPDPSAEQLAIMELASRESERMRRRFGLSRRSFVRTAAASAIGFWAIDAIRQGSWGNYGWASSATLDACDLEYDGKRGADSLMNLPGEFIFDVQSHHVDPHGMWRVTNPAIHAFFAAIWPQSSAVTGDQPGVREDGSIGGGGAGKIDRTGTLPATTTSRRSSSTRPPPRPSCRWCRPRPTPTTRCRSPRAR